MAAFHNKQPLRVLHLHSWCYKPQVCVSLHCGGQTNIQNQKEPDPCSETWYIVAVKAMRWQRYLPLGHHGLETTLGQFFLRCEFVSSYCAVSAAKPLCSGSAPGSSPCWLQLSSSKGRQPEAMDTWNTSAGNDWLTQCHTYPQSKELFIQCFLYRPLLMSHVSKLAFYSNSHWESSEAKMFDLATSPLLPNMHKHV